MLVNTPVVPFIKTMNEVNVDFLAYRSNVFHFDDMEAVPMSFSSDLVELRPLYLNELSEKIASLCSVIGRKPSEIRYSIPSAQLATYTRRALSNLPVDVDTSCKLLILDRSFDMTSPLIHDFTYLAMAQDLLEDSIEDDTFISSTGTDKHPLLLDMEKDPVQTQIGHKHIYEAMDWLSQSIASFSKQNVAIQASSSSSASSSLTDVSDAIKELPKFHQLSSSYSSHLHLAESINKTFKERNIQTIATLEQEVATGFCSSGRKSQASDIFERSKIVFAEGQVGREDLLRFAMLLSSSRRFKQSQIDELMKLGNFTDEDSKKSLLNIAELSSFGPKSSNVKLSSNALSRRNSKTNQNVDENLLMWSGWTPVLKHIIEELSISSLNTEEYPAMSIADHGRECSPSDSSSPTIIVFVVGGITFSEIRSIYELMSVNRKLRIMLGSTHLIRPNQFVKDMSY